MNSKSKIIAAVMITIILGTTTVVFPSYAQGQTYTFESYCVKMDVGGLLGHLEVEKLKAI